MALLEQRTRQVLRHLYPRLVKSDAFGLLDRLVAKLDVKHVGNGVYLDYCARHKTYFLDRKHTNGVARCPVCDEAWLFEHGY